MASHNPEVGGSNPPPAPTSERTLLRSDFLYRKISHTRRRSSFFAKRHTRLNCSLVNALAMFRCRYHLFASMPAARISQWFAFPNEKPLNKAICAMLSGFCFYFKIAPRGEFWVNRFWILSVSLENTGTDVFDLRLCFRYLMCVGCCGIPKAN